MGPPSARTHDPLIQVHQFDDDTFVLRVSKCFSFEGNFIYLLFGDSKAVMFDTGGLPSPDNPFNHGKDASCPRRRLTPSSNSAVKLAAARTSI